MSGRSADNLTWRQEHFLNDLVLGGEPAQVIRNRKIHPATLLKWAGQPEFMDKWERCNKLLALRAQTEIHSSAIRLAQAGHTQLAQSAANPAAAAPPGGAPFTAPATAPPPTAPPPPPESPEEIEREEREYIRLRHGEEAARGFDRLVQIRKQNERAATPPPTPPPTPNDSPPSAPSPNGLTTPTNQLAGAPQVPSSPPFSGVPEGPLTQPQFKPDPQSPQPEAQP